MPSIKHTHMYHQKKIYASRAPVWACGAKDCTHYMPFGTLDESMIRKTSICWNCGNAFSMTSRSIYQEYPTCSENCENTFNTAMEIAGKIEIDPMIKASQERIEKLDRVSGRFVPVSTQQPKTEVREMKTCACGKPADLGGICRECYKKLVGQ